MTTQTNGDDCQESGAREVSRKQFEAWAGSVYDTRLLKDEKGNYRGSVLQQMWEAWQASRADIAIEIDWPEANDDYWKDGEEGAYARGHEDGKDKTSFAVRNALNSAGIKVNP